MRREASDAEVGEDILAVKSIAKLLLTGLQDQFVPPAILKQLNRQFDGRSDPVIIPCCGHLSQEEASESLLAHLASFIARAT